MLDVGGVRIRDWINVIGSNQSLLYEAWDSATCSSSKFDFKVGKIVWESNEDFELEGIRSRFRTHADDWLVVTPPSEY